MSTPSLDDSSQELFYSNMSRPVVPPPPPPSSDPLRLPDVQPQAVRPASSATTAVPPPPPAVAPPFKTSPPATPATAASEDSAFRSRVKLIKLRRERRWAWLKKVPGYKTLEALWMSVTQVRDTSQSSEEERKRELPAWLVSFVVHVVLILILALIPIAQIATSRLELIVGDFDGEGAIEFTLAPQGSDVSLQGIELPLSNTATNMPELDFSVPAITPSLSAAKATEELGANLAGMAIEQGLAGRSGSLKGALLAKFGGNATTEASVKAGLKWLAYQQLSDGGWSLIKNYSDGAANEDRTAATAMALNAFLGAGHTHKSGEYKELVDRGLQFLLRRQDKEGFFANGEPSHNQMYSQAIATITVCEAYGLTSDSKLRIAANKAIKFAEWSQGRQKGWRYEPRDDSDLSVTGWYMMALMTGKMAGLEPDEKVIRSVADYLETVSHDYGARYSYQRPEPPTLSMTAEGLLCRQYLGWPSSHPALQRAIKMDLLPNAPELPKPKEKGNEMFEAKIQSVYYWYYATQVLHHVGGKAWTEWNNKMKVTLPALQETKGQEAGSWDPKDDQFGPSGGRLYTTCLSIYCLEVYYRHLSLYDMTPAEAVKEPSGSQTTEAPPETDQTSPSTESDAASPPPKTEKSSR